MSRRSRRCSLAAVLLLLPAGCGRGSGTPPGRSAVEQPPPAPSLAPLTGVPLEDSAAVARPVVAVKIDNLPSAGPQDGLDAADVVFEEVVEGGITRFLALFHSRMPERVGPIRSARPEDAAILPAFEVILFISGARPDVAQKLAEAGVVVHQEDGRILRRDPSRRAPHNVFANGSDLFAAASSALPAAKPPAWPAPEAFTAWTFDPLPPAGAVACPPPCGDDPGQSITVKLSEASLAAFRYDVAGVYHRLEDARLHPGTGSGSTGIANVVVLATQMGPAGCCDPAGNPLTATQLVGSGRALVLRDGQRYEATWSKPSAEDHFAIIEPDGSLLPLKPGRSWVVLAPAPAVPTSPS